MTVGEGKTRANRMGEGKGKTRDTVLSVRLGLLEKLHVGGRSVGGHVRATRRQIQDGNDHHKKS